jgi:hypothetical protein
MAESPSHPYRIVYSGQVRQQIQEWARNAKERGILASFLEEIEVIEDQMASAPFEWGEKSHHLHSADLSVCDGFHARIHTHFAVDEGRQIVYVVACRLLPGHPLANDS